MRKGKLKNIVWQRRWIKIYPELSLMLFFCRPQNTGDCAKKERSFHGNEIFERSLSHLDIGSIPTSDRLCSCYILIPVDVYDLFWIKCYIFHSQQAAPLLIFKIPKASLYHGAAKL